MWLSSRSTLELAALFAVGGSLLAVAVPAFFRNLSASKLTEPVEGLNRMVTQGAWFQQAAYPYLTTVTCAGHATISTGMFPHTHGVFQNAWWDREARKQMTCTADPNARDRGGDTAVSLARDTLRREMNTPRAERVESWVEEAREVVRALEARRARG